MKNTSVLKAKRFGIYSCSADQTLKEIARIMNARNISALVVVDDGGYLSGIITRTDLVRACYERDDWAVATVNEYMSHEAVTVGLDEPLLTVMELLLDRHIHRVVAVAREPAGLRPVAVLSAADILYHMSQD
jgi:signal-transduction protein with cAMP-binding, CBS, and nucleotidyltransferase domain